MMSHEQNRLVTRSGADTPGGALLRRYWQPVALIHDLESGRPVVPVRVLGEDLVAFRDESGRYGLLDRHCSHRGADLCYGRLEDGGLRCPFHGWLFDVHGRCLEQPAEPIDSVYHTRVRHLSYACEPRNGILFAYLGSGEPPPFTRLDCFAAPQSHVFAFKGRIECNWLQALEVGIDPAHASFLHRFLQDSDPRSGYGLQFRDSTGGAGEGGGEVPVTRVLRNFPRPRIEVEETDYGLRIFALRELGDGRVHLRVTNQVFPQAIVIPMSREMTITQWHVPIDDERCDWYALFTSYGAAVDRETMRAQRLELYQPPDYRPRLHAGNRYGYDWREQLAQTYTGMGPDINVHDQWAVESMGPIQDRTREHLGQTDVAIRAFRRKLLGAIGSAADHRGLPLLDSPRLRPPGPAAVDAIFPAGRWREAWAGADASRRAGAPW